MQQTQPVPGLSGYRFGGHGGRLGIASHASGADWCELALPWRDDLLDEDGALAAGPLLALMDTAASIAVWLRRGRFVPHATLDLRLDRLRAVGAGRTVIGRGECVTVTPTLGFVRGVAHDGDPADPVAAIAGTFMTLAGGVG